MADGDNRTHSEVYAERGAEWAELEAAAALLEQSHTAWRAQRQLMQGDIAANKSEMIVKASQENIQYIETMVAARKRANLARINLEVIKMEERRFNNTEANTRQELRMTT